MRYSLRALLLLVLLAALPMAWLAKVQREYTTERRAIEQLDALGIVALPEGIVRLGNREGRIEMAPPTGRQFPSMAPTFEPPSRATYMNNYQQFLASGYWTTIPENLRARRAWIGGMYCSLGDEVLPLLADLPHMESIELLGGRFTESGVEELRHALPDCEIDWKPGYGRLAKTE